MCIKKIIITMLIGLLLTSCESLQNTSKQSQIDLLTNKNEKLINDLMILKNKSNNTFNKFQELEKEHENLLNKLKDLKNKNKNLTKQVENLKIENSQLNKEKEQLKQVKKGGNYDILTKDEKYHYIGLINVYEKFLKTLTNENFYQYKDLTRKKCLDLINQARTFTSSVFGYQTLSYDYNREMFDYDNIKELEDYYLVTDDNIKTLKDLQEKLNLYFTNEITAKIIDDSVDAGNKTLNYKKRYKIYNNQLFALGGECGADPTRFIHYEYSVFKVKEIDETQNIITYNVIIPYRDDSEFLNENRYSVDFLHKQIQFKFNKEGWRLNTDIRDLWGYGS